MQIVYVGCRTTKKRNARGEGLVTYRVEEDGSWKQLQCLFTEDNPSFQCMDATGKYLYSVHGDITKVTAYRVLEDGTLEHINTLDIGPAATEGLSRGGSSELVNTVELIGRNPVDITIDKNNENLVVATLQGGTLYTIARKADGSLDRVIATFTYEGKEAGTVSMIHQCYWDKKKNYLFACAQGRVKGYGQMRVLKYNEDGSFTETDRFMARTWDEPRHAAMHPNNRWLYMVEEKGNKVLYFSFDEENGKLKGLQELSTVPETVLDYSDASEVMVDPSGEYVLVSNRYTDSMMVYRIDQHTGYLKQVSFTNCPGKTPRFFCFGPDGRCYVAHEDSDTIVAFEFDTATGMLKPTTDVIHTGSPVCITFA